MRPPPGTPLGEILILQVVDRGLHLLTQHLQRKMRESFAARRAAPPPPATPALHSLQLTWPCDAEDVQRRFEDILMERHPDRGGAGLDAAELRRTRKAALAEVALLAAWSQFARR